MSPPLPSGFDRLWSEAIPVCRPDAAVHLLLGEIKFILRPSALAAAYFDNFLAKHVCPAPAAGDIVHEVAILFSSEADGVRARLPAQPDFIFTGTLIDDRTISLGRQADGTILCAIRGGAEEQAEEAALLVDPASHRSVLVVSELAREGDTVLRPGPGGYLVPFLNLLLSTDRSYLVHAAAVAHQGRALLLLGPSGAGKTTMSLALARAGLEFMGDDLIIVNRSGRGPRAYSFWTAPKVKHPITGAPGDWDDRDWRRLALCRQAQVGAVALLNRSPDGYRLDPCPPAALLTRLLGQGNDLRFYFDPPDWFATASALCQNTPGYIWTVGDVSRLDAGPVIELLSAADP